MGACGSSEELKAQQKELQELREENKRLKMKLEEEKLGIEFNKEVGIDVATIFNELTLSKQRKAQTAPVMDAAEKRLFREVSRKLQKATGEKVGALWTRSQEEQLQDNEFHILLEDLSSAVIVRDMLINILNRTKSLWRENGDVVTEEQFHDVCFKAIGERGLELLGQIRDMITEQYNERALSMDGENSGPPLKRPDPVVAGEGDAYGGDAYSSSGFSVIPLKIKRGAGPAPVPKAPPVDKDGPNVAFAEHETGSPMST